MNRKTPRNQVNGAERSSIIRIVYEESAVIKVSVMYPATEGAIFDHDYYRDVHMPLAQEKLGAACICYEVDKGISGAQPGSAAPYVAMCHLFCESVEAFAAAMAAHGTDIAADIINFTDLTPLIQISEIVEP